MTLHLRYKNDEEHHNYAKQEDIATTALHSEAEVEMCQSDVLNLGRATRMALAPTASHKQQLRQQLCL